MANPTNREPRERLVLDLLVDAWTKANTFDQRPHLSFGWFDEEKAVPQVTVPQPSEDPVGGGTTGFSGMDPSTGDPTKTMVGSIGVHVWCRDDQLGSATTENAREFNERAAAEIQRIIDNNADQPVNPSTGNQPVNWLSHDGADAAPEDPADDTKAVQHHVVPVRYGYGPGPN